MSREGKPANQVNARRIGPKIVAYPSRPVEEVWIVTGETDQTEGRLHH
jgi:hypothetical protein